MYKILKNKYIIFIEVKFLIILAEFHPNGIIMVLVALKMLYHLFEDFAELNYRIHKNELQK